MPTFPPRLTSILTEANAIAPHRRTSSDGMLGDAAHRAEVSDHNPDANGVVHAVDISESKPGTPYWQPGLDVFDVHQKQRDIAAQYVAATAVDRVRRWPWLTPGNGYMVGFDGSRDVIFNPSVSLTWRDNGGTSHNQHGHFSIGHSAASENDTQPIFGGAQPQEYDMPLNKDDIEAIRQIVKQTVEEAIGGGSLSPPDPHATVVDVVKHYAK